MSSSLVQPHLPLPLPPVGSEPFVARAAGEIHGSSLRFLRRLQITSDKAKSANIGIKELLDRGALTEEEASALRSIVGLVQSDAGATEIMNRVRKIYEEISDRPMASEAAIVIAGIAANSTQMAAESKHATLADVSPADIAGAIVGTLAGGVWGGIFGGLLCSAMMA